MTGSERKTFLHKVQIFFVFILFLAHSSLKLCAQLNEGGLPRSFTFAVPPDEKSVIQIHSPVIFDLQSEDERNPVPYRYAVNLPVDLDIRTTGHWSGVSGGTEIWRLEIFAPGARAMTLYFSDFNIPSGGKLFIYNPQRTLCLGAFTERNHNHERTFASSLLPGERLILEYDEPEGGGALPDIHISEVAYAYRGLPESSKGVRDFGQSGACEVNINCSEGQSWQQQKQGVARVSVKKGFNSYWCSGSLVNNVRNDGKPYFLTADHCGYGTTPADISRWIFYFHYEAPDCSNPALEPAARSMTGASLIAHGGNGGEAGSDFFLVLLKENIPDTFNVYYNGWSREITPSPSGAGIHHPEGDIQKISTYNTPLISSDWNGHPYMSHWKVTWIQTPNGHGVTEGGSSGSPIFDNQGHIVGTLTGGNSQCGAQYENLPDYYGKFSYSWDQNGTDSASVLKYWLDPDSTGIMVLDGQATAIGDLQTLNPIQCFPNPFTDQVNLRQANAGGIISVKIYNQTGQCVYHAEPGQLTGKDIKLDLHPLSPGFYFLKVNGMQFNAVLKIIKL